MKILPNEAMEEFREAAVVVIWVASVLVAGTGLIAAASLLAMVSQRTQFGTAGAAAVALVALVTGLVVHRRRRSRRASARPAAFLPPARSAANQSDARRGAAAKPSGPYRPSAPGDNQEAGREASLDPAVADDLFALKSIFSTALDRCDFSRAEGLLERIASVVEEQPWCANQRRQIEFKRRAAGGATRQRTAK